VVGPFLQQLQFELTGLAVGITGGHGALDVVQYQRAFPLRMTLLLSQLAMVWRQACG
jgi:hypothetical protein